MTTPNWLTYFESQLDQYKQSESPLEQIINDYTSLLSHSLNLSQLLNDYNTPNNPDSFQLLVQAKSHLQSQYHHALNQFKQCQTQLHAQEQLARKLMTELTTLKSVLRDTNIKLHDATHLLTIKDNVIVIAQDELTATQIELSTKERRLTELEKENRELLDQWLALKALQAVQQTSTTNNTVAKSVSNRFSGTLKALGSLIGSASSSDVHLPSSLEQQSTSTKLDPVWPPTRAMDALVVPTRLVRTIEAHSGEAFCLTTSFDGTFVASGGDDKLVHIWSSSNAMSKIGSITGILGSVLSLSFSSVSTMLVAGSSDNAVRVYKSPTPGIAPTTLLHTFTGHMGKVTGVKVSGKESIVASCSGDRTLKLWDVAQAYCMTTLFAYSACTDLSILDYSVSTLVSTHLDGKVRVWDAKMTAMVNEIGMSDVPGTAVVSVNVLDFNTVVSLSRDSIIRVVDLRQAKVVSMLESSVFRAAQTSISLSPGGHFVAAGASDGSVFGFDLRTLEHTILTGGHGTQVNECSWNPYDPTFLYSIDKCGHLTTWGV